MKRLLFISLISTLFFSPVFFAHAAEPIRVLLAPGHDNRIWGAQYGNVKEAAMNLAVASRVFKILDKDERFEVFITRDTAGYTPEFADYLSIQKDEIVSFRENAKEIFLNLINDGLLLEKENVPHNSASEEVSVVLYGINKWANENDIDAVIHMHFNDYNRKNRWEIGKYTGFAVYLPEEQMANADASLLLAVNIFVQLNKKYTASTYEKEQGGIIPSQKLIALGSNGTLLPTVRSVLIEYGYVYEKIFRNYTTRHRAYDDMAGLTAAGIKEYFLMK